jgi:UDP-glucose 4-epimerase
MNILVIGGNGFIGSHLVDYLLLNGHNVRVFDVSHERYRKPLLHVDYRISTVENTIDVYEALLGIDIVFHLASTSVPSSSNIDPVSDINKNLINTINILNLVIKLGIKRFIYFSSGGAVYGNPIKTPISEEHPLKPISSYGIVKSTVESYLSLYQRMYDFHPLILRPSNPYGPRQNHFIAQGVISTFLMKLKLNEGISVFGDGNSEKDYIYIDDLIKATYLLALGNYNGVFNIGSGVSTSINRIIQVVQKITEKKLQISYLNNQEYDVLNFVLDIRKISKLINWQPTITIETGVEKLWTWIKSFE